MEVEAEAGEGEGEEGSKWAVTFDVKDSDIVMLLALRTRSKIRLGLSWINIRDV